MSDEVSNGTDRDATQVAVHQDGPTGVAVRPVEHDHGSPVTQQVPAVPLNARFAFDGGAATYFGTAIAGILVTVLTLGICTPWAICMTYRWRTKHTLVDGYRMRFTGSAASLFGHWVKWFLLTIVTVGIYGLWVAPRLVRWITEHQEFDTRAPRALR